MISSGHASFGSLLFIVFSLSITVLSSSPKYAAPAVPIRRQESPSPTTTPVETASLPPEISSQISVGAPTDTTATLQISTTVTDEPLATLPVGDNSLTFGCKRCSLDGDFTFTVDPIGFGNSSKELLSGGVLQISASNFGGTFEMDVSLGQLSKTWEYTFFSQAVVGFGITNTVNVGVLFELDLEFEVTLDEPMDVTFGIDFRAPDNATITIDVANEENSSSTGFTPSTGLRIDVIPFQANLGTPKLTVSLALKPKIVFGMHALGSIIFADAGAYVDIPKLRLEVDSVKNVDSKCNAMDASDHGALMSPDFGDAVNVIPSAEMDIGLLAEAQIAIFGTNEETTLTSAATTLSTACLLWDKAGSTLADATKVIAASSSASSASAASAASASASEGAAYGMARARKENSGYILSCLAVAFLMGVAL
ncbi:MAG: hypothetical protein M1820_008683 [Bogoriella megaspora]|nr:MAG: hypothetical protein M1820_008683 [Bogoriella megaspora]